MIKSHSNDVHHIEIDFATQISMAILTIIGATKSTIDAGKSIYRAPEELESLQNDLSDMELMVTMDLHKFSSH